MSNLSSVPDLVQTAKDLCPLLQKGLALLADITRSVADAYEERLSAGSDLDPRKAGRMRSARAKLLNVAEVYDDLYCRLARAQLPLELDNSIEFFLPVLQDFLRLQKESPERFNGIGRGSGSFLKQIASFTKELEALQARIGKM